MKLKIFLIMSLLCLITLTACSEESSSSNFFSGAGIVIAIIAGILLLIGIVLVVIGVGPYILGLALIAALIYGIYWMCTAIGGCANSNTILNFISMNMSVLAL